jgi:hypothetical protein
VLEVHLIKTIVEIGVHSKRNAGNDNRSSEL